MRKENIKNRNLFWFLTFIIGSVAFGSYYYWFEKQKEEVANTQLGTCQTPEEAYKETQKALRLISSQLNFGMKNVNRLREYDQTTLKIFKK
ncbi:hypothetical protein ACSLMH_06700 [Flavobacterium columnare]|uniref:hypothetical protein n=1 Tax=Flavobacterium columnare TaxID=996 RepID=UPI0040337BB5